MLWIKPCDSPNPCLNKTNIPGKLKYVNIELNMLPLDSIMWLLDFLLEYSTGDFQALQHIVFEVLGTMD